MRYWLQMLREAFGWGRMLQSLQEQPATASLLGGLEEAQ
jgi:hypothetical protein